MKMIHTCLRVLDLERSKEFYQAVFGLHEHARYVFESFTLLYLRHESEEFELELTSNHGQSEPYQHGNAYGHLAFVTEDLQGALDKYRSTGAEDGKISELHQDGKLVGKFFFATDPDGYKVEILEASGRFTK